MRKRAHKRESPPCFTLAPSGHEPMQEEAWKKEEEAPATTAQNGCENGTEFRTASVKIIERCCSRTNWRENLIVSNSDYVSSVKWNSCPVPKKKRQLVTDCDKNLRRESIDGQWLSVVAFRISTSIQCSCTRFYGPKNQVWKAPTWVFPQ